MIYREFYEYIPTEPDKIKLRKELNIIFIRSSSGDDWYDCQRNFKNETAKIVFDEDGVICAICNDVSGIFPSGLSVAELENIPDGADSRGGWVFNGEKVVPRTYTSEELVIQAEAQKERRIAEANKKTQAWQTQLMLGMINDKDKKLLIAWMEYVQRVQAIDTNKPEKIVWPPEPK